LFVDLFEMYNISAFLLLILSEEQLSSIAERTILEADQNGDQMISFEEFCNALGRTDVEQRLSIRFLN
jgi:calcineurin B family protein 1